MFYADSSMGSAPIIRSNDNTSLCAALDALLVNGFGSYTSPGWTIEYTATSKRVYRPAAGNRFYLRVDESSATTYARIRGYETMSDVDTGTNPFPTIAQISGSGVGAGNLLGIQKGATSTSTIRNWYFFGDQKAFYIIIDATGATNSQLTPHFFGDFIPYYSGYSYNTAIGGISNLDNSPFYSFIQNCKAVTFTTGTPIASNVLFVARNIPGTTYSLNSSLLTNCAGPVPGTNPNSPTNSLVNADSNKLYMNQMLLGSTTYSEPLGKLPGLWEPVCGRAYTSVTPLDTATDNAYDPNRTFVFFSSQYSGIFAIEKFTSGNW